MEKQFIRTSNEAKTQFISLFLVHFIWATRNSRAQMRKLYKKWGNEVIT